MELLTLAGPATMLPRQQVDAPWDGLMMVTFSAMLPGDSPCCRPFGSQASTRRGSSGSTSCKRSHSKASSVLLTRPSGCMLTGPCRHCGINFSPQWRKGTHDKPVLCNACGIRLRRHKCLDESTAYKGPPLPPVVYASVPEEPAKDDPSVSQQDDSASAQQDAPSTSHPALVLMLPGAEGTPSLLPATAVSKADAASKAATAAAAAAAAGAASLQVGPKGKRGRSTVQLSVPGARSAVSEGVDSAGSDPETVTMPPAAAGAAAIGTAAAGTAEAEVPAGLCQAAVDAMDIDASSGSAGNSSSGSDTPCQAPWPAECGQALLLLHNGWPLVDGVAMEPAAVAAAINAALVAAASEAAQVAATVASTAAVVTKPAAGEHGKSVVAVADAEVCAILSKSSAAATAAEEEEFAALGVPTPMAVETDAPARSASPTESMPEEAAAGDTEAEEAAAAVGPPAKRQRVEQQWQVQQEQQQEDERAAQHSPSSDSGSSEDGSSGDGSSEDERSAVAGAVAAKAAASALLLRSMEATTCMTDGAARLVLPQSVMA